MGPRIRLFGEAAFEMGLVTTAQLYEALTVQARLEVQGEPHRFLGEILVDLGYLSERKVLEILSLMHRTRVKLRRWLQDDPNRETP